MMMDSIFGWEDTYHVVKHTQELLATSQRAKERLPELQKAFNNGLEPGEYIEVKAPFKAPDGNNEWMWVEVTSWKDDTIKGLLDNEPVEATYLRSGQLVTVRQEDVFDYLRHYADKHVEGNTTGDILKKMDSLDKSQPRNPPVPVPDCIAGS